MRYVFTCNNCKKEKTITCSMNEISSKEVVCDDCGQKMHQKWTTGLNIPETMRSTNTAEMDSIVRNLKHSRPSGRSKILF